MFLCFVCMIKKEFKWLLSFNFVFLVLVIFSGLSLFSQTSRDSLPINAKLIDCIRYAINNQPSLKQSLIDEEIAKQSVRVSLSDWLPQIEANASLQHYFQAPALLASNPANINGSPLVVGNSLLNASGIQFSANQTLFNNDVFIAGKTAKYYRLNATQNTENAKIDLVIEVSKAFYDIMLTQEQLSLIQDDIERLARNLKDTYSLYKNGISDKIDFKRATISLNNAQAEMKNVEELLIVKYDYLRQLLNCPVRQKLVIAYDSASMANDIFIDTTLTLPYQSRIEFKILQTQLTLQKISCFVLQNWVFAIAIGICQL